MHVKTKSGFEAEVRENLGNDYRYLKALRSFREPDNDLRMLELPELCELTLGKDGARKLEQHLAQEDGSVPMDKVMEELFEIWGASKQTKNS